MKNWIGKSFIQMEEKVMKILEFWRKGEKEETEGDLLRKELFLKHQKEPIQCPSCDSTFLLGPEDSDKIKKCKWNLGDEGTIFERKIKGEGAKLKCPACNRVLVMQFGRTNMIDEATAGHKK